MTDDLLAETEAKLAEQLELEDQILAVSARLQLLSDELLARRTLNDQDRISIETLKRETLATMKRLAATTAAEIAELERTLANLPPPA